ncbi:hypothetical protein FF38_05895 [Lucilia cuprina]|uniref:CHK kinase-like domain-containing protein n=1 Tax=Lucilia cuprina TaxID=7375 RepID=A0A0L0BNQ4_LUCCU|nr:hypothetical protein CVS40_11465 [Lucilia cuprina]KNC21588.1 hypothetical protein FF38_05895 [Lucilia cuprina]
MSDIANNTDNVPAWVEAKLFENVLKENVENFKEIKEFKAYAGLAPGENYSTIMTRIEILIELEDSSTDTKFFMLKTEHESKLYKELVEGMDCFGQEPKVYEQLIPAFEKLYHNVGQHIKFGAKYYKLPTAKGHLLLEDLCRRGFKNANRLDCLDMKHAKMTLKKLAQWHAASAVHKENIGSYGEIYKTATYHDIGRKGMSVFFEGMIKYLLKCLHLYDNPELYKEKVEKLLNIIMDEIFKAVKIDENDFNVLNHADLWTNNIMFQYSPDGELMDTYFVDYAFPKYGSPAQDLLYFIISSLQVDIKIKQFDHLIQYYHENLVENLQLLKYTKKVPSLKDIHIMLHKYGIWGFATAVGVMAVALVDSSEMSTFDNFLGETNDGDTFKLLMFTNKRYHKHMNAVLPWLLNRGALDF